MSSLFRNELILKPEAAAAGLDKGFVVFTVAAGAASGTVGCGFSSRFSGAFSGI
ncbi:hypothetical protein [Chryseobacterium indologenes]|uniref:hypothetical protein n=1 Tax=Chryseobacterium indologenes TaxID=253 RepID=UPI0012FEE347|nr:hypothetical protein [Chryseobacterium indologenes]